jgi:hypothetical protein
MGETSNHSAEGSTGRESTVPDERSNAFASPMRAYRRAEGKARREVEFGALSTAGVIKSVILKS